MIFLFELVMWFLFYSGRVLRVGFVLILFKMFFVVVWVNIIYLSNELFVM